MTDWGLEEPEREQLDGLVVLLRDILRDTMVAVYLHGSAVLGGLRRARAIYLGTEDERWDDLGDAPSAYGRHVAGEIRLLADRSTGP